MFIKRIIEFTLGILSLSCLLFGCKEEGFKRIYYESGELKEIAETKNGKYHGSVIEYYPNGNVKFTQNWYSGKVHGESRKYFENGALNKIDSFRYGIPHGISINYYKNGKVENIGRYENGFRIGEFTFYNEEGILVGRKFYDSLGEFYDYEIFVNGEIDSNRKAVIVSSSKDSIFIGDEVKMKFYLGNNEGKVIAKVGLAFDSINYRVLSPIGILTRIGETDGFLFTFKPKKQGQINLYGIMEDQISLKEDQIIAKVHQVYFECSFYVIGYNNFL